MKKKIAILGSTGSIGKILLNIIENDQENFEIVLLSAKKNYSKLLKQAKQFKVKNLIITEEKAYNKIKNQKKIKVYNSFENLNKIFSNKIDYVMSSIVGIDGLIPTTKIIKFTKKIAIANKESIICGWNIIKKELKKNNTKFIPVDSEHFSLWYGLQNLKINEVEKIYITASGGPFNKRPLNQFKKIKIEDAINHPNWKMGKKISIDSATMINKVYEVIEAKNIFDIPLKKIEILVHPNSYVHAMVKFKNGLIKIIAHETTMKIPIYNTLYKKFSGNLKSNKINIKKLNQLDLNKINYHKFPIVKILDFLPSNTSLYDTVIVSTNDTLVDLFLKNKINFTDIHKYFFKWVKNKEFVKFKKISSFKVDNIIKLNEYVRLKIQKKVYKS